MIEKRGGGQNLILESSSENEGSLSQGTLIGMSATQREDYERARAMKIDDIRQELSRLGVQNIPRVTKENLIKLYVQTKQEVSK